MSRKHYILDETTDSTKTIERDHHQLHEGLSFTCHYRAINPALVGDATVIAFSTPNTAKWLHMVASASASLGATFSILEAPSIDVDEGTQLTIFNRDRNSATTSVVTSIETAPVANKATSYTVLQAGTANITGTEIYLEELGVADFFFDTAGGYSRGTVEWVLKKNTQYAFKVANLTASATTHNIVLNWYEHTNLAAE